MLSRSISSSVCDVNPQFASVNPSSLHEEMKVLIDEAKGKIQEIEETSALLVSSGIKDYEDAYNTLFLQLEKVCIFLSSKGSER